MAAFDAERFREAVLYTCWRMRNDQTFGRVKLAKTLFYADFESYAGEGRALTGARYEHWDFGPFPPALYDLEEELETSGLAKLRRRTSAGEEDKLLVPEEPATRRLEDWQKQLLDLKMKELAELPSWKVSDESHEHPAWRLTADREEIPYAAALVPRPPSVRVREIARRRFQGQGRTGTS